MSVFWTVWIRGCTGWLRDSQTGRRTPDGTARNTAAWQLRALVMELVCRRFSGNQHRHDFGYADWFVAAVAFDGDAECGLGGVRTAVQTDQFDTGAQLRSHRRRGGIADLIAAVVDSGSEAMDFYRLS